MNCPKELYKMTIEQLKQQYVLSTKNVDVGPQFYLDEIARREQLEIIRSTNAVAVKALWVSAAMVAINLLGFTVVLFR